MSTVISAPAVSANEDMVVLAVWHKADGEFVKRGDPLCSVETTKATVDVEAEADGFLHRLAETGSEIRIGAPIAALTDSADEDVAGLMADGGGKEAVRRWTKKAAVVAKRLGIDIETLAENHDGGTITEAHVLAAQPTAAPRPTADETPRPTADGAHDLLDDVHPANRPERILLLGGGAGAGAMTVDVLARIHTQRAVGILDGNPATHGKTVGGVPVLGPLEQADALWKGGFFDSAMILFTQDIEERAAVFEALKATGIRFANIIDSTVDIRAGTALGEGNLIMANVYFSTAVTIGDNNFFASHCCVEHHSRIGSHCAFGPRTTTSGGVTIGDRVKTGMAVAIEPYVTIGGNSLIASGCVITTDVPPDSIVKAQVSHSVRPRGKS